jgi:hypothetical protein
MPMPTMMMPMMMPSMMMIPSPWLSYVGCPLIIYTDLDTSFCKEN